MSNNILDKARELGLELSKSEEFNRVKEAETLMMQNLEAQSIIQEYQAIQHTLQTLQAQGQPLTESLQRDFGECQRKMFSQPQISSFFQAQEKFEIILDQVNKIISESIGLNQNSGCEDECQTGHGCGCGDCK